MRAQEFVSEQWSRKYKRSINCARPRGFSQRAHCQARKNNEDQSQTIGMKTSHTVTEAPLTDYEPRGFEPGKTGGFRRASDRALVTNPVVMGKLEKFFSRTPYEFRLFPIQVRGGAAHLETGEVSPQQLTDIVGEENAQRVLSGHTGDTITVVYTNNTGANPVPMTPWIMSHRIGHAVRMKNPAWKTLELSFFAVIQEILTDYYGVNIDNLATQNMLYQTLFTQIGTMRSARRGLLPRPYEFLYEMLTQYINSGQVQFNPAPQTLYSNRRAWGRPQAIRSISAESQREVNNMLQTLSRDMSLYFNDVLNWAEGRIFVV